MRGILPRQVAQSILVLLSVHQSRAFFFLALSFLFLRLVDGLRHLEGGDRAIAITSVITSRPKEKKVTAFSSCPVHYVRHYPHPQKKKKNNPTTPHTPP